MPIDRNYKSASPDEYKVTFNTPTGRKVFEDLLAHFYHIQSFKEGDPYATAFNEGHRYVMGFIRNKMLQAGIEPAHLDEGGLNNDRRRNKHND